MVARSTSGVLPLRGSDPYAQRDRRSSSVGSLSVWHSGVCARMSHAGLSEHEPSEQDTDGGADALDVSVASDERAPGMSAGAIDW